MQKGKATKTRTGWFEVTVDGELVHSKKVSQDSGPKLVKLSDAVLTF